MRRSELTDKNVNKWHVRRHSKTTASADSGSNKPAAKTKNANGSCSVSKLTRSVVSSSLDKRDRHSKKTELGGCKNERRKRTD